MFFLASNGYRCIAHDRRGHGRSSQPWDGNEMDTYADDLAQLFEALDLKDAIMIGHSTGGGEVARYLGRHGTKRVASAVLVGAVPPIMLKTAAYPGGLPIEVFDGFRKAYLADRAQFFLDVASGPVLRLQPPGRQGLAGLDPVVVAAGHDERPQERLRLHQGVLRDRLHRGPEADRRADADRARRRRPDRAALLVVCEAPAQSVGSVQAYDNGLHLSSIVRARIAIALGGREPTDDDRLTDLVAANRGTQVRSFRDVAAAKAWLAAG